ncbi:MAG: helix-turn-helix domain-containing protein [Candidatus Woesearchaeota archaeon]
MTKDDLEEVIGKRRRVVETVMHKFLGVSIKELNDDITSRLGYPFEYIVDTSIPFKKAKKLFIKSYIEKVLKKNLGNISEASKEAGINRRTMHRMITEFDIDIDSIRGFLERPDYMKKDEVNRIIEGSLKKYDEYIHPSKLGEMYKHVSDVSTDIIQILPDKSMTLKEAEENFERAYLKETLKENNMDEKKAAEKIGIRYETLHRKLQAFRKS